MRMVPLGLLVTLLGLLAAPVAQAVPTNAEVVLVRHDCASSATPSLCFSTMAALNAWLPTRTPAGNPVIAHVGPGDWDPFVCNGEDNVTIRGSGRDTTRILRNPGGASQGAMDFNDCAAISVEHLTVHSGYAGVTWSGGGSSTWTDVDILAGGAGFTPINFSIGWYDTGACGEEPPLHYFFGSRVTALGNATFNWGFVARCAEHWFFGGELMATNQVDRSGAQQTALLVAQDGDFRLFGTAVRSNAGVASAIQLFHPLATGPGGGHAVAVIDGGTFHAHGSILNASADTSSAASDTTALGVSDGAVIAHTPGTAFVVKPGGGGGTASRTYGPGAKVQSPFLWQQGTAPPAISSIQGADAFVETDCSASSCSAGGDPHLMLYSTTCAGAGGPWFDTVTGACRVP